MHKLARRSAALVGALTVSLALAACGGGDDDSTSGASPTTSAMPTAPSAGATPAASSSVSAEHNDADVTFAQNMIAHHRSAIAMAELAETQASTPEVKALAAKIKTAQAPEIETMTSWLQAWGEEVPEDTTGGMGHDAMGRDMPGMPGVGEMANLEAATGVAFDRMFLEMMTAHHQGAIEMAQTEQADGQNPQALELAATIQADQSTEIDQMRQLLQSL